MLSILHAFKAPLTWRKVIREGKTPTAVVICRNGHEGILDEHEIRTNGDVIPSLLCTQDNCDFHEYIRLEGWNGGI